MATIQFETYIDENEIDTEDGGAAKIILLDDGSLKDHGVFFVMHSWDEELSHTEFEQFEGRRVRVTVETITDA